MKNFPHQFNDLSKLFGALEVIRNLVDASTSLTDDNLGQELTRQGIYTYRDKTLSVDQFLESEQTKPAASRGYLTVSRDIRRFFELLGFIIVFSDKTATLNPTAIQMLSEASPEVRNVLWKNALLQLGLDGPDGVSHPYRILLKLVDTFPGIETSKLMLALEAKNDSDEEFQRISDLAELTFEQIIGETGTSLSMARNAVKILPGIAEQLGDIERTNSRAYAIGHVVITEDEISTEESESPTRPRVAYRATSSAQIAQNPQLSAVVSTTVDMREAIQQRQRRLAEHQEIVRSLALINEQHGFVLFDGKFDCLAKKNNQCLLYEIKTLNGDPSDEEKQIVKGVGQLKFYDFSIARAQMGETEIQQFLVFSRRPSAPTIDFLTSEGIKVLWRHDNEFRVHNSTSGNDELFDPDNFLT